MYLYPIYHVACSCFTFLLLISMVVVIVWCPVFEHRFPISQSPNGNDPRKEYLLRCMFSELRVVDYQGFFIILNSKEYFLKKTQILSLLLTKLDNYDIIWRAQSFHCITHIRPLSLFTTIPRYYYYRISGKAWFST